MVSKVKEKKERLDVLLVKRGLMPSREKAKAVIMAGEVFVDNQREDKAGQTFPESVQIEVRGKKMKYVSRGGYKLEQEMNVFPIPLPIRYVWMSVLQPVALRTVCCKMAQSMCTQLMWGQTSLRGR